MKRRYVFTAGVALGVAATRRTRRAKVAAREALKAKLTPSAIAADLADAIAEVGNAVGSFASDVKQGAANRRASYRPVIDNSNGAVLLLGPEKMPQGVPGPLPGAAVDAAAGAAATERQDRRSA
ncbi:hypothetical protein [Nakamurella lactea]|uniref:hypothetical protein n=1 Tax=Nakamurella lactea TaxID=459515 RepID=UPI0004164832|nr:hypothetical protein [Nakamurella lactea]